MARRLFNAMPERPQESVPLEDTAHFAVSVSIEPAFDRARHISRSKDTTHHRDIVPTKGGSRRTRGIRDPGERDIDTRTSKIVDLDHGVAPDGRLSDAVGADPGDTPWRRFLFHPSWKA